MNKLLFIFILFPTMLFAMTDYDKAEQLYEQGEYAQAKVLFENFLKQNVNHTKTMEFLGDIACIDKNWNKGIEYYKKIKEQFPKNANYWYKYGGAMGMKAKGSNKLVALSIIDDVENAFLTAAQLDIKHTNARWALVMLYLELPSIIGGSEKKSQKYADELMSISKIDGLMSKGYIEEYYKRYTAAEKFYKQGIEVTHSKMAYQKLINLYKNKMNLPLKAATLQEELIKHNIK